MVSSSGDLLSAAFGPVPRQVAPLQQARNGEDYAYYMLSELAEGQFETFTDCQGTLGCVWDRHESIGS
eukprot:6595593-Pyramimonas_sp.AAC.1